MATIVSAPSVGASGAAALTTVPAPGDLLVFLYAGSSTTPTPPSGVTGCGATWTEAHRGARTAVWIGTGATATGNVVATLVSGSGLSTVNLFHLRDVAPTLADLSWAYAPGAATVEAAPVVVAPTQAVVACAFSANSLPAPGSLPSVGEWSNQAAAARRWAWSTPVTAATYKAVAVGSSAVVLLQVVVGSVPPPPPPTALRWTGATSTTVTVEWDASVSATGYEVRVTGGEWAAVGDVTTYDVTSLVPSTTYLVEVRAVGPGGSSAAVQVAATTESDAAYRAVVRLGERVWDVLAGDPPALGPVLPVSFGWAVPEDALGFPAQPDPDLANLELVTADHADLAGVDIGTPMRVSLYTSSSPTARPLATFRGRVADMEAAPHPLGLSWRVLGVGYDTDLGALQVGTSAWPQESGDARAARVASEAGLAGWSAPAIGSTFEAREPAATTARAVLLDVANQAVSAEGTSFGPSRRVLIHPTTDDNGDLTAAPFHGAEVLRRVDALDVVSAGLVNRATTWRRTKLLDATWVRIDHPGGPTTYGDTRGPAYPPQSVTVTDPRELADLILDTTPGYRWLTGQPLRLELWADDGPALAVVSQWFYRDPASPPFPWSGRAVLVRPVDKSPDGSATYAGMLTAATMRLEHDPARGGRLVVEFRLRPDIPAQSTVTMRWMDEPPAATWADELATDPTGTWYDYYTTPRP